MKLTTRIIRLSQKQKIILGLSSFVVLATIGMLSWAMTTGQIKPKAASAPITNTASVTYQDSAGITYNAQSNTVLVEVVPVVNDTVNISLSLQTGTNFSTAGTVLTIYQPGTSTVVFQKTNVSTDSSGNTSFVVTPPNAGYYDYKIKSNGYLTKSVKNTAYASPLTLSFGSLKAGDLNGDNHVTLADFINFRSKFGNSDPIADFDHDGKVTLSDFITFRTNYLQTGD